jgi:hypothetical protein
LKNSAPKWLISITVVMTLAILFMAVAETTLWTHWLIDQGEYVSLAGLAFILVAGLVLHRQGRLRSSLPLTIPWLIYPVITQGDQIIDNLTINNMRLVCHVILGILFGAPIAVLVLAAKRILGPKTAPASAGSSWAVLFPGLRLIQQGRSQQGALLMILALLLMEIWVAIAYLGALMVATLIVMGLVVLYYGGWRESLPTRPEGDFSGVTGQRLALLVLLVGVTASFGLYVGFKNRPGAYQGSPSFYHDPSQMDAAYPFDRVTPGVGLVDAVSPETARAIGGALAEYGDALESLTHAYYVLDRNYNYAFHNALFLRHTPVLAGFREKALADIAGARSIAEQVDHRLGPLRAALPESGGLGRFLDEVSGHVAYNFRRAAVLEEMSGRFERTQAGLQHATHIYEGEGKRLGEQLTMILEKHHAVLEDPGAKTMTAAFVSACLQIQQTYANRIVGF